MEKSSFQKPRLAIRTTNDNNTMNNNNNNDDNDNNNNNNTNYNNYYYDNDNNDNHGYGRARSFQKPRLALSMILHTAVLHNKIPPHKIFARVWVAQEPICS